MRGHLALPCIGAFLLCAGGCVPYRLPDRSRPPVAVPAAFSAAGAAGAERWWEDFHDPALSRLVTTALGDNLDIRRAWARLRQAALVARQAGAPLWPEITAEGSGSRTRSVVEGPMGKDMVVRMNSFKMDLAAAYELDLWGRVLSQKRAAGLDARASREDLEAAAITVAATVGELWYSLVEQRAQRALLAEQIKVNQTLLGLVELRFAQGAASALDVYQQRQHVAATRGQVPGVESRLQVLRHQLAVLLGRPPGADVAPARAELPRLPPLPATGLPADLLQRRPDVRAALLRLVATDHRVAAAVADRLPSVRLTGLAGFSSDETSTLLDRPTWTIAGGLLGPVFDAGRRAAEVSRVKAQADELLAAYGQTILTAFREVEDALVQERRQREFLASVERQVKLATATLREARQRYIKGLSDYLPVLNAVEALHRVQRTRVAARRQLISFRIRLYRALGGSWPKQLKPAATRPVSSGTGETQ